MVLQKKLNVFEYDIKSFKIMIKNVGYIIKND